MPTSPMPELGTLLTVKEAAALFGCSIRTVYRKLHEGELTRYQLSAKMVRVRLDEVLALIKAAKAGATVGPRVGGPTRAAKLLAKQNPSTVDGG